MIPKIFQRRAITKKYSLSNYQIKRSVKKAKIPIAILLLNILKTT